MINSNNNNNVWGMYIIIGYYYTVVYVYMIFDIKGIHVYVPYTEGAFFCFWPQPLAAADRDHPTTTRYRTFRLEPGRFWGQILGFWKIGLIWAESCRTNIPAILMPCCLVKKKSLFLAVAKAFLMTGDSRVIYLFFTLLKCGYINTHYYTCVMQEATKTKRSYIDI
jgi:hypothetical protein